jgi:hypothetical protein
MEFAEGALREYLHQVQAIREEVNNLVQRYPDEHFERICIATHTNVSGDLLLADKLAQAREGIAMCARRIQFAEDALRECLHIPILIRDIPILRRILPPIPGLAALTRIFNGSLLVFTKPDHREYQLVEARLRENLAQRASLCEDLEGLKAEGVGHADAIRDAEAALREYLDREAALHDHLDQGSAILKRIDDLRAEAAQCAHATTRAEAALREHLDQETVLRTHLDALSEQAGKRAELEDLHTKAAESAKRIQRAEADLRENEGEEIRLRERIETVHSAAQESLECRTIRLCRESDTYTPGHRFAGFILYGYHGKDKWVFRGKRCRSGYIVILDSGSTRVESIASTQGQVRCITLDWIR